MKKLSGKFGIAALAAVFLFFAVGYMRAPSNVEVFIPQGATGKQVAALLASKGLIWSAPLFDTYVRVIGREHAIKSGLYRIDYRWLTPWIARAIISGKSVMVKITIPEGFTAAQVAERFSSAGFGSAGRFVKIAADKKMEGYLFPETYFFEPGTSPEKILDKMKQEFDRRFTDTVKAQAKRFGLDPQQTVVLASIVEREAQVDGERRHVSGVFHNRLRKGWLLESCATVDYALGRHKRERLTYADLKVRSPYNTYMYRGLPPGPICNPGLPSLLAAADPEKTEDMFFVTTGTGTHRFSRYLGEHLKARRAATGKTGN